MHSLNTPTPEHPADYCSCCCGLATPRVTSRMSQGNGFVWQDRWDQCWHLLTDHLAARDLICLCLSSRSLLSRSNSTGGWWQQACSSCLSWPPPSCNSSNSSSFAATPQPGSSTISAEADQRARQVLLSATALAHHLQHCRWTPAQTVQIPPWLPGQPGRSRGFVRLDPSSLDPPLLLKPTELNWLAHGSLSGHTSGVFISSCSSSPRTQQPCAQLAAVVSDKALVAELYIPRSTSPVDPWPGILSPVLPGSICSSSSNGSNGSNGSNSSHSTTCPVELWLSSAVQLQPPQAAAAAHKGRGRGSSRGAKGSRSRGGASGSRGVCWTGIHQLVRKCIGDNASRCKAARGTTVIPPGTPTAAAIEHDLLQLAAAGGPVLDLRRLDWEAAAAGGQQLAAAAAALEQAQQQPQRGRHARCHQGHQTGRGAGQTSLSTQQQQQPGVMPTSAPGTGQQHAQQRAPGGSAVPQPMGGWGWQPAAMAVAQTALAAVHAAHAGAASAAANASEAGAAAAAVAEGVDDGAADGLKSDKPELLAALVEKLHELVPDVQLLVLPVLLPGGRAAQRVPSVGGTRLSAPKLLCLNVPFLMALRQHAWEQLPRLRHVLLMAGPPPAPLAAASVAAAAAAAAGDRAASGCGGPLDSSADGLGQQPQQQQGRGRGGGAVAGTFRLEDLEQQWQQQLQLGQALPQQQQQQVWDEGQQDAWFEQQVAQQRPRQCAAGEQGQGAPGAYRQLAEPLTDGCVTAAATRDRACVGGLVCNVLSRAAVDALRDMVHSCMDR